MAFLFGVVLAISIVPASSNVIKHWDPRHPSLFSSENAKLQARDTPPPLLPGQIEETISTGSDQARLEPRDSATVTISLGGIKTLSTKDSTPPSPTTTAVRIEAAATPPALNELVDTTSIKTDGALAHPTDTAADAESSALPTSPPKGAILPPPPVLGTGGEHTLEPLELRAVAAIPIPTNHPTLVTIHAITRREDPAVGTSLEPLEPRAITLKPIIPIPTNHPTLVTIHAATNQEALPLPTIKPTLATVYASQGATGIPITAQRQLYTTYSPITTCEYDLNTTAPFIATAPPPPLQAECKTHLSPVVTSYCSTSIPQLATTNITVTNCNQQITYATTNGYSIVSSNSAPAIQTLTTYSAAVWDAISPGLAPTAGERIVCTQGGRCRTTPFFRGAVATNGSAANHPPYTLANSTSTIPPYASANSTGTPLYPLANSSAGHFTVPAPFARGTGSYPVPLYPIIAATGSAPTRAANSTVPTFQWLNTATTTPQARLAATSATAVGQQSGEAGEGYFWGVPAQATVITDTLRTATRTNTPELATTSSVIDIGF